MTRSDDELLRDALRADAGSAEPSAAGFDEVRATAETRARRRRWQIGVAAGSIAAVAAAVVGVVALQDDDPSGLELTPPAATSPETSQAPTTTEAPTTTLPSTSTAPPVTTNTLPPAEGFAGVTDWRTVELGTLDAGYVESAATPQAKVDTLVEYVKNEPVEGNRDAIGIVTEVAGNRAQVEVRTIGFPDDAIGASDLRLYLLQEQPGGPWIVVAAESREYCVRGFDGTYCV